MFGQPEPVIAPVFGMARQIKGIADRVGGLEALGHRR